MIRAILATIMLMAACTRGEYWEYTDRPRNVLGPFYTDNMVAVCGQPALGCFNPVNGAIWLVQGMPEATRQCVITHEYRHAAGWRHPKFDNETTPEGIDCGDGTTQPYAGGGS
jgi:hypothetical protein